ncbi:MAG: methyltransferase domain-containing protein [Planctomycetes bacterium]|nr:methyltransferase domain-containing protein [Planctomycetota bacterium]
MYDALARWQWRRRRDASSDVAIELRKRLRPRSAADATGPVDGGAGLDHWLRSLAEWRGGERVLDLGCGFGASSLRAAAAGARACFGVTPSRFQVAKAQELAAARGLAAVCTFAAAEFEQAPAGPFDVVFAIESLAHAEDLAAALRAVRARLAPTGVLLWLDDRRVEVEGNAVDPDVRELAECWASPPLPDSSTARAALAAAGLQLVREVDLTDRVPFVPPGKNRWRRTVLRGLGAIAPTASWRAVLRAFRGGLALERLYARGACRYLLWMARPFDPTA